MNNKPKLVVSFSGGRTSAYMLWFILNKSEYKNNYDIKVIFANTGKETEKTLEFVRDCSINFGIEIIWLESYPKTEKGWGVGANVVTFETASRKGEPFELMISKLGIPSSSAPFCSFQLKRYAINAYLKTIGWGKCYVAIGIRADEIDRVNPNYLKLRILYPLINTNIKKSDIIKFWRNQTFDLKCHKDLGNCDGCWKKSAKTLVSIARQNQNVYNWWQDMTDKYGNLVPEGRVSLKEMKPPFNFYRGDLSPKDIKKLADLTGEQLELFTENEKLDGCSESCEVF